MSLDEFREYLAAVFSDRPANLRLGQHAYAVLHERCPEAARDVSGTGDDPFYSDARMPYFLARILMRFVGSRKSRICKKRIKKGTKRHKRLVFDEKIDDETGNRLDQEPQTSSPQQIEERE